MQSSEKKSGGHGAVIFSHQVTSAATSTIFCLVHYSSCMLDV